MKKILITGAKGQLGNQINKVLGKKHELILTDSDSMDITDLAKVESVTRSVQPDFIIHGAAYTKVDLAETEKEICHKINAQGTENIAKSASNLKIPLFYISTDYVFDGVKNAPYNETDEANPLSVYGQTKLEGEIACQKYCKQYYVIRTSWLFGELPENAPGSNFVETMLRLAKERDSLSIVADQIGSPTYTKDLVLTIEKIIEEKPESGIYHLSGEEPCSWYDFAKEIFKLSNVEIKIEPINSEQYPQAAQRPKYSYLSKEKINNILNTSVRSWQEMTAEYLKNR